MAFSLSYRFAECPGHPAVLLPGDWDEDHFRPWFCILLGEADPVQQHLADGMLRQIDRSQEGSPGPGSVTISPTLQTAVGRRTTSGVLRSTPGSSPRTVRVGRCGSCGGSDHLDLIIRLRPSGGAPAMPSGFVLALRHNFGRASCHRESNWMSHRSADSQQGPGNNVSSGGGPVRCTSTDRANDLPTYPPAVRLDQRSLVPVGAYRSAPLPSLRHPGRTPTSGGDGGRGGDRDGDRLGSADVPRHPGRFRGQRPGLHRLDRYRPGLHQLDIHRPDLHRPSFFRPGLRPALDDGHGQHRSDGDRDGHKGQRDHQEQHHIDSDDEGRLPSSTSFDSQGTK
jgi:hypothetical protein